MTSRTRNVSIALAGAVVLASGAYAIGSQSGSGTSGAATATTQRFRPGGPMRGPFGPDLSALADKLGVSTTKLRDALDEIRSESRPPAGDPRANLVKALADGLNLTQAQVIGGLDKLR